MTLNLQNEFENITLIESGISHTLDSGVYFLFGSGKTEIEVIGKDVQLFTLEIEKESSIAVSLAHEGAGISLGSVVVSGEGENIEYSSNVLVCQRRNNFTQEVLVLVPEGSHITAKIGASVEQNAKEYSLGVHESALLLGNTGYVREIPELQIASDDGKASHSARAERISTEMIAYLSSRGISSDMAREMYISSRIRDIYVGLPENSVSSLLDIIFQKLKLRT